MTDQRTAKSCACTPTCGYANTQSSCNCGSPTNAKAIGQAGVCEIGCPCGVNCACTAETNCLVS